MEGARGIDARSTLMGNTLHPQQAHKCEKLTGRPPTIHRLKSQTGKTNARARSVATSCPRVPELYPLRSSSRLQVDTKEKSSQKRKTCFGIGVGTLLRIRSSNVDERPNDKVDFYNLDLWKPVGRVGQRMEGGERMGRNAE